MHALRYTDSSIAPSHLIFSYCFSFAWSATVGWKSNKCSGLYFNKFLKYPQKKISISTSQIFRSLVAMFQPRPPMVSLFRRLYDMPGLAHRMDVLLWGRCDFQITFSNRYTSGNAWNRHWESFMVDTGILSNNMKFLSYESLMTFCDLTIYNDNPLLIRLCTELDLLPNFERFP